MKVKLEFVTNSSSTNFIVADYRKNTEKILVEYDWGTIDLLKVLHSEKISTYERYKHDYDKNERVKEAFEGGAVIYVLYASDDGMGPLEAGFCRTGIEDVKVPEGVKILQGEGGY